MKHIVFVIQNQSYFRFVDGVIRELCCDGVRVTVITEGAPSLAMQRCKRDVGQFLNFDVFVPFARRIRVVKPFLNFTRELRAYLHWMNPDVLAHHEKRYLGMREIRFNNMRIPYRLGRFVRGRYFGLDRFDRFLRAIPGLERFVKGVENVVPPDPMRVEQLRELEVDAVVCVPLIFCQSKDLDYMKAARSLGIPAVAMIASWDNLTTKQIFWCPPDLVMVWNEVQRREAENFHSIPKEIVRVTGAAVFDHWFTSDYDTPRETFLRTLGMDPEDRYILYVASSSQGGEEEDILMDFLKCLRSHPATQNVRVIVRQHPSEFKKPFSSDVETVEGVMIWPKTRVLSDTFEARQDYFNTLKHTSAVIGLNTSVFVEGTILDKPSIAITPESKRIFQWERAHFNYLVQAGILATTPDSSACVAEITQILAGRDERRDARARFVRSFIRPIPEGTTSARVGAEALEVFLGMNMPVTLPDDLAEVH